MTSSLVTAAAGVVLLVPLDSSNNGVDGKSEVQGSSSWFSWTSSDIRFGNGSWLSDLRAWFSDTLRESGSSLTSFSKFLSI